MNPSDQSTISEITAPSSSTLPCPIRGCTSRLFKKKPSLIQHHLMRQHTNTERMTIPRAFFQNAGAHQCPLCPTSSLSLHSSHARLASHIHSKHKTTTRSALNSAIILSHFPKLPSINADVPTAWKSTLRYLHRLDAVPFSFRKSIYHRLDLNTKKELNSIAYKIYYILSIGLSPHVDARNPHTPPFETLSSPLWKLALLFEGSMLAPPSDSEPRNYQKLVANRIRTFREGRFQALHKNATLNLSPPSYTPSSDTARASNITRAANHDNWRKASKLLKDPLPAMPYTDANLPRVLSLHPPPAAYTSGENIPKPTQMFHAATYATADTKLLNRLTDKHLMLKSLRKLSRDTASGPFADSTDFLRDVFLTRTQSSQRDDDDYYYVDTLVTILTSIYTGNVPKDIQDYLSFNESVCFYKDPPKCEAVRPIGIGVAWRRVATAHAMSVSRDAIATYLSPHQFAIGLNAGLDFVTHTMQTQVDRYITEPPTSSNPPSRAILLLDLANMFNTISMVRARDLIFKHFPHLLPLFDTLYYSPTKCWYRDPTGARHHFLRQEGSSQGCPFAAFLACLVLHEVIQPLSTKLAQRAHTRKRLDGANDDGLGSLAVIMTYIDDCTASVHYDDLRFFIEEFDRIGTPLGCVLKQQKCKILTSTTNTHPRGILPDQHALDLNHVLSKYCGGVEQGEVLDGVRILGAPIGCASFVQQYQNKTLQKLRKAIAQLKKLVKDPQIATSLFKFSLQHYVTHLLFTDVLHNACPASTPLAYSSSFTNTINSITQSFLSGVAIHHSPSSPLPPHAWYIATAPTGMGGLGFDDATSKAVPHFIKPLASSIRAALHGMTPQLVESPHLEEPPVPPILLPKHIVNSFRSWKHSSLSIFQTYREIATQYANISDAPPMRISDNKLLTYTLQSPLHMITRNIQRKLSISNLNDLWPNLPDDVKQHFPSLMSFMTAIPMGHVSRNDATNHFAPDEFRVYMQRKMRLPLWPRHYKCMCGTTIDQYGDHYFTCRHVSKTHLHHRMRDALHLMCSKICPLVSDSSPNDVHLETPHLIDQAPLMRPGDVVVRHPISTNANHHALTMIDVTVVPPAKSVTQLDSYNSTTANTQKHHMHHEYTKFRLKDNKHSNVTADQIAQEMIQKKYRLLPFSVDHLGSLGNIAMDFLIAQMKPDANGKYIDCIQPTHYSNRQTSVSIKNLIDMSLRSARDKNLLHRATKNWTTKFGSKWFTNSYHAQTPAQWAKQVLGNTFSLHSSKHILRAMSDAANKTFSQTPKSKKISCCSMNLHTPTNYTVRSLQNDTHST